MTPDLPDAWIERWAKDAQGTIRPRHDEQDWNIRIVALANALTAERKARSEAERKRDEWKARRDAAIELCQYRHQDGLTAAEWHEKICGAAVGATRERERAEKAEAALAGAKSEALREITLAWQSGEWADVLLPVSKPPAIPAIDYGQRVTNWLRTRAEELS